MSDPLANSYSPQTKRAPLPDLTRPRPTSNASSFPERRASSPEQQSSQVLFPIDPRELRPRRRRGGLLVKLCWLGALGLVATFLVQRRNVQPAWTAIWSSGPPSSTSHREYEARKIPVDAPDADLSHFDGVPNAVYVEQTYDQATLRHTTEASARGLALLDRNRFEEASVAFTEALAIVPEHAPAYYGRAFARYKLGEFEAALADFAAAIRLNPTEQGHYLGRAMLYQHLGRMEEAIADATTALELNPRDGDAYFLRATLYERLGNTVRAAEDRRRAGQF